MDVTPQPRVAGLLAQPRHVGDTQMRGLRLYHHAIAVEGVGFRVCGDVLVGAPSCGGE